MTLKELIKLTQVLQDYSLTVIQWQILLVVAENPGQTITDLVNDGQLTCGTPSDIAISVKRLGEGRHDRPGFGLIKKVLDENDRRYARLTLSASGKRLVKDVMAQLS